MREELATILGTPLSIVELKHKPGRRRTVRAAGPAGSAIVKSYTSDRAATVAARVGALGAGPAEPLVPRVILCDPRRRTLVLSYVPGTPLGRAVDTQDAKACARAGSAIGAWHAFWSGRAPHCLSPHTSERELEILDARAGRLSAPLAARVRELAARIHPTWASTTVVHRDLYEDQVMVGESIGLIDLDDAALGPPELDVGNLLAHLALRALRAGEARDGLMAALVGGYARTGPQLDPDLLDRCRRLSLLRLACIHQEPRLLKPAASPGPGRRT
jgi:Ser/Thr protein kinase RdoA (MazF antagonist)